MGLGTAWRGNLNGNTYILEKLICFPTVSHASNLDLIEFVGDKLRQHSIATHIVHSADDRKANLHAAVGPVDRTGIILSGHSDVGPVEGQNWTLPPFIMTERQASDGSPAYRRLNTPETSAAVDFVKSLTGTHETMKVAFATEGGLFSCNAGNPSTICGPGSMEQGHTPDEFVSIEQLCRCDEMLDRLLERAVSASGFTRCL